ncbi:MAG: HlyD family efflux transporter periplasmic adaptor subunit, partial [Bacteroidota bacterium]
MSQASKNPQLEAEDIYLRSEELQEVLGRPPGWVVRSGMLMIALFFLLLTVATYFVRSYDRVPCPVKITTQTLPASVEARQSGKISHLFVTENQVVAAGVDLAVIQSTATYEDVQQVRQWLQDFQLTFNQKQIAAAYPASVQLGALEPAFTDLQNAIEAYHFFKNKAFLQQQQQQLSSQVITQQTLQQAASQKEVLIQERLALTEQIRAGERALLEREMLSQRDNANAEKNLIEEQLQLAQTQQEQARIQLEIEKLQQRIQELDQLQISETQQLSEAIQRTLSDFTSAIDIWEEQYVLRAPIAGKVSFFQFWSANQEVNQGDEVMVVIPPDQNLMAYAYLPVSNAGKVAP